MHARHELELGVVSPEEAEFGIAEFWAGDRFFGFTRLEDGEDRAAQRPARWLSARTAWPRRWRARSSFSNPRDTPHPSLLGVSLAERYLERCPRLPGL
jgi:hypothetical protein